MKKQLLAGVALLALVTYPAFADLPVVDITSIGHLIEMTGISTEQLTQLVQLYNSAVQLYNLTTKIWADVEELVGADTWAPGLAQQRNPLPFTAAATPGYIGGFTDPARLPYGQAYLGQNTVGGNLNAFQDDTFVGTELVKAVRAISAIQATNNTYLDSLETRLAAAVDIVNRLATAATIQETNSINARWLQEQHYVEGQISQAIQLDTSARMQALALEYNQRQWEYLDETQGIGNACASVTASGSTLMLPTCLNAPARGGG
jgi:hypothetical protein